MRSHLAGPTPEYDPSTKRHLRQPSQGTERPLMAQPPRDLTRIRR
jgi:hypothetical protein